MIEDVKIVFVVNWWDGPLEGMCLYNNEKHWFRCVDDDEKTRIFALIRLTPEQIAEEENWHKLFLEKVGESYVYVDGKRVASDQLKPEAMWHEFYDVYKPNHDYNDIIGHFEF